MELQRITLNMQISLIHSIGKQAAECAERWARPRPSSWADCSRVRPARFRGHVAVPLYTFEAITNGETA